MSEFQLSLLIIGLLVVAGVYLYGAWQQWRYRRSQHEAGLPQTGEAFQKVSPKPHEAVDQRIVTADSIGSIEVDS